MFEQLAIKNFQPHRKRLVVFDPVTTIVGPNDVGKSAFLRVLRWICLNQPQGSRFITWGRNETRNTLFVDGQAVTRLRTRKGRNQYRLGSRKSKAFKTQPPEHIASLLNLDASLNFQGQHEGPYWFALTPGQVGKALNAVVDLSLMDESLARLGAWGRKAKLLVQVCSEQYKQAKQSKKALLWVPAAMAAFKDVEAAHNAAQTAHSQATGLHQALTTLAATQTECAAVQAQAKLANDAVEAAGRAIGLRDLLSKLAKAKAPPPPDFWTLDNVPQYWALKRLLADMRKLAETKRCALAKLKTVQKSVAAISLCPTCQRPL